MSTDATQPVAAPTIDLKPLIATLDRLLAEARQDRARREALEKPKLTDDFAEAIAHRGRGRSQPWRR